MTLYIPLLESYLALYTRDPNSFTDMIGKLDVPKQVVNALYEMFVHRKELDPIESLSSEDKTRIWDKAKGYPGTQDQKIMISRCIYLFENICK